VLGSGVPLAINVVVAEIPPLCPAGSVGGSGAYFANCGDDVHAVGSLAPLIPGAIGCIVIRPDGTRVLARAVPDPLAKQ
jgi:hypothetical protein